jgi:hypothetical protein
LRQAEIRKGGGRFCSVGCRKEYKSIHAVNYLKIGRRAVHRIVAEQKLGRPLRKGEVVHHIDGNRFNNAPDNLMVVPSHSEHLKLESREGKRKLTRDRAIEIGKLSGSARRKHRETKSPVA